jgi:hypothetical protein
MTKKIYTIEAQICSLLRSGKKLSISDMAKKIGTSENMIHNGIHSIRKNVHLPEETILRIGKNGNSEYELVTNSSLEVDKIKRLVTDFTNMRRMIREVIKLSLISRATTNPNDIASLNNMIVNLMTDMSREVSQMTMLQMPSTNI